MQFSLPEPLEKGINNNGKLASYTDAIRPQYEEEAKLKITQNTEKINTFFHQYISNINELMKNFITYKLNSTSNNDYDKFIQSQVSTDALTNSMQTLSYQIQDDNMKLKKQMEGAKALIVTEEKKRSKLAQIYVDEQPIDNSSSIMISNSVENYKSQYISNWIMFIGIIIISISLVKVFKK